jgi:serine/threonine-protein kinase HipA
LLTIQARHWHGLAMKYGGEKAWQAMLELKDNVGPALDRVEQGLPSDFPVRTWRHISKGMRSQVARFEAGLNEIR